MLGKTTNPPLLRQLKSGAWVFGAGSAPVPDDLDVVDRSAVDLSWLGVSTAYAGRSRAACRGHGYSRRT